MKFVYTPTYLKAIKRHRFTKKELEGLESDIEKNPLAGDVIPGLQGYRKIRFAARGKGKRGGGGSVYYYLVRDDEVFMMTAYPKSQKEDLTKADQRSLLDFLDALDALEKDKDDGDEEDQER